jgi:hypothetical protein
VGAPVVQGAGAGGGDLHGGSAGVDVRAWVGSGSGAGGQVKQGCAHALPVHACFGVGATEVDAGGDVMRGLVLDATGSGARGRGVAGDGDRDPLAPRRPHPGYPQQVGGAGRQLLERVGMVGPDVQVRA